MTDADEILLEQNFSYKNMSMEERNFYINMMMNTKDVCDSEIFITNHDLPYYDLFILNLNKEEDIVSFDGVVNNEYTTKLINGTIEKRNNKYLVKTNVYIYNDYVFEPDKKEYGVYDEFIFKDNKILRRSRYEDDTFYESEVFFMNEDEMDDYLQNKCDEMKLRRGYN